MSATAPSYHSESYLRPCRQESTPCNKTSLRSKTLYSSSNCSPRLCVLDRVDDPVICLRESSILVTEAVSWEIFFSKLITACQLSESHQPPFCLCLQHFFLLLECWLLQLCSFLCFSLCICVLMKECVFSCF